MVTPNENRRRALRKKRTIIQIIKRSKNGSLKPLSFFLKRWNRDTNYKNKSGKLRKNYYK